MFYNRQSLSQLPLAYWPRFFRCPCRSYCMKCNRIECDKCGVFLEKIPLKDIFRLNSQNLN